MTDALENTLLQDNRWYQVGEIIFKDHESKEKLDHIKYTNEVYKCKEFFSIFVTRCPCVKWGEFKGVGIDHNINKFGNLPLKDNDLIANMFTNEINQIITTMAPVHGSWKYFIDHYIKENDRKRIKTKIEHLDNNTNTVIEKFISLINGTFPEYAVGHFFRLCKNLGYNDTLKDLMEILDSSNF